MCAGAFIAAAAGLLDGRRVTTHWAAAQELQSEYPALEVDPDPLYIRDGEVWSSAGVTAGIDLALALVADDLGADVAQTAGPVAGHVLAPAGQPDPVRHAGLGAQGRALRRPGHPGP